MTLVDALWLVHDTLSGQKTAPHQLAPRSSEEGMDDEYDDGVNHGPSPAETATEGEDQSSTGARSKHPMDGALLTPQRKRTREGFDPFSNLSPSKDGLRKDQGKGKKTQHYFAYPKSCGFSWNCHGQLVFFSNEKYNFDALKKDQGLKRFREWPAQKDQLTSRGHDAHFRAQTSDHDPKNQHLIDVTDRDDAQSQQSDSGEEDDRGDEYTYYGDEGEESEDSEHYSLAPSTPAVPYRGVK